MKHSNSRLAIFAFCAVLSACNGPAGSEGSSDSSKGSGSVLLINGAGATFPAPIYTKWFDEYHKKFPNLQFNYQPLGSGAGIRQLIEGTVDFGATDAPMTDEQLQQAKTKIFHVPTVLGAAVLAYNLPGITTELKFTPEAIAGMFLGKIKKWDDPELKKANPGVSLPSNDIVIIHRSDGSGTTFIWVDYLSKVSPEWKSKVGVNTSVNWPVGLGGKGSDGVSGLIKQTPNSVGYVELVYALQNKMSYGHIKNLAGNFIKPDLASVTAAAAGSVKNIPEDFRVSITNAPGEGAYPVSSFTWLLIPASIPDQAKKNAIKDFLAWMLSDGQNMVEALSYARLPAEVVSMVQKVIPQIE